jgi:AbrB family looped-hinge helix DNA binding protein
MVRKQGHGGEMLSDQMASLTRGLPTKSAKIRALASAGYKRADIARHLGIRYQHVRNVLLHASETQTSLATEVPDQIAMRVGPEGRIVIPVEYRKALGIGEGDEVIVSLAGDELRIVTRDAAIRRVQAMIARYVPKDVSLVEELIAERRREAAREESGG